MSLMQLRWTAEAASDLERIVDYVLLHAPDRAPELIVIPFTPLSRVNRVSVFRLSWSSERSS